VPVGWSKASVGCALPASAAATLLRRLQQWSLVEGGRIEAIDGSTVVIWSNGVGAAAVPRRIACFVVEPDSGRMWVRQIAWDPMRSSAKEVWRMVFLLAGTTIAMRGSG